MIFDASVKVRLKERPVVDVTEYWNLSGVNLNSCEPRDVRYSKKNECESWASRESDTYCNVKAEPQESQTHIVMWKLSLRRVRHILQCESWASGESDTYCNVKAEPQESQTHIVMWKLSLRRVRHILQCESWASGESDTYCNVKLSLRRVRHIL